MSSDDNEIHTRRRDTSWVKGELVTQIGGYPDSIRRFSLASRYYLTDENTFEQLLEDDYLGYRNYWRGKVRAEELALAFASLFRQRHGLNGVGVAIDFDTGELSNCVVYDEGGVDWFDPTAELIYKRIDAPDRGILLL